MSKTKKSVLNAIVALCQMLVTSVIGLVLNKAVLDTYGSIYNGINSTITQIVNSIMIIEAGFTLASNVALFEPWSKKLGKDINGILSATNKRFKMIGMIALLIGVVISFIYPFMIKEDVSYSLLVALMFTVLLPTCFNLGITTKYRVVLLTDQKEYIISFISTFTYLIGNVLTILAIYFGKCTILTARSIIMCSLFVNYLLIGAYCKKKYKNIRFNEDPLFEKIKGTKSVMILKLTAILYSSAPVIILSMLPKNGLIMTSVYSVYNSVVSIVSRVLEAIVNAPRLSFGALFVEKNNKRIKDLFSLYEMITCMGLAVVLGTTAILILPFIKLYTRGISDVNYYNETIALLLIAKTFVQIIHIPSGQMIQMAGFFDISKKIQLIASIILSILLSICLFDGTVYTVIIAILSAAIILAVLEIVYTEKYIINRGYKSIFQNIIPALIICIFSCWVGISNLIVCENYFFFLVKGIVLVLIISLITLVTYYVLNKENVIKIFGYIWRVLLRKDVS